MVADLFGFWLLWHLEGGFEGLERLGMNRATIYRKINRVSAGTSGNTQTNSRCQV